MRTRDRDRMLRRADEAEEKARKDFRRSLRATKATNGMGTIYFIGPPDRDVVKIGWTSGSPYRRLKNIQSGNHTHLELLAAIAGTKEEERRLHDYFSFALYREGTRSEWFLLTIEMRMLLELFKDGLRPNMDQDLAARVKLNFAWLLARPSYEAMEEEACRRALQQLR